MDILLEEEEITRLYCRVSNDIATHHHWQSSSLTFRLCNKTRLSRRRADVISLICSKDKHCNKLCKQAGSQNGRQSLGGVRNSMGFWNNGIYNYKINHIAITYLKGNTRANIRSGLNVIMNTAFWDGKTTRCNPLIRGKTTKSKGLIWQSRSDLTKEWIVLLGLNILLGINIVHHVFICRNEGVAI